MGKRIKAEVAETMVENSVGQDGGLCILEIMKWVFGRRRTKDALEDPDKDPEFVEFSLLLDSKVNLEWQKRGIDRRQGPYVKDVE